MPIHLALKFPVTAIMAASGFGAVLFAEATPPDYQTPGMIIAALFTFIGTCCWVIYKGILGPICDVFVANLKSLQSERDSLLKCSLEREGKYIEVVAQFSATMTKLNKRLDDLTVGDADYERPPVSA
jgi:hypothetical protein